MKYVIFLTPKNNSIAPHIWKEGGSFNSKEGAEFQAKQTRKMKDLYSSVIVIPEPIEIFLVKDLEDNYNGAYLLFKQGEVYAIQYSGKSGTCSYPTKESAIMTINQLAR